MITHVQKVVGSILYYARLVDRIPLVPLSTLASEQSHATENTIKNMNHMLDYLATNPNVKFRFYPSDMILNAHSDVSYLSAKDAKSRAAGHFFLGWEPDNKRPIRLNGPILTLCTILKFVAASAAESELGAIFLNAKEAKIIRLALEELSHPQPPTPMHCDNAASAGIANNTMKRKRSQSMGMRYLYICDLVKHGIVNVKWHPGQEIFADYASKHHDAKHHKTVRPLYLHEINSPRELLQAMTPHVLGGRFGTKLDGRPQPLCGLDP